MESHPLSSIIISNFQEFHPGGLCPRTAKEIPKDTQREPKGTQREPKGAQSSSWAKGSQRDNTEFIKNRLHAKYTMLIQPKRNTSFMHQLEKWEIHPEYVVCNALPTTSLCSQQTHIVPRSIQSVWYHYFNLNIQEMTNLDNQFFLGDSQHVQHVEISQQVSANGYHTLREYFASS